MKKIAVLSTFLAETHARQVLSGIFRCAGENDCCVVAYTCKKMQYNVENKHDVGEYMIFDLVDFNRFDGVILASSTIWSEEILQDIMRRIKQSGIPAVSLEKYSPDLINVAIDNCAAMKEIMQHMIRDHGYRRINYISGVPGNAEALARHQAFVEALAENDIPYESERVYWGDWTKLNGEEAVEAFFRSELPFPEAIVCSSDKNALGAYTALNRLGFRVPQDVALSGFDDDFEGMYHIPSLTSVARMPEQSGYIACQAVLRGMSAADKGKMIMVDTSSVFRESCGCANRKRLQEKQFRKLYFQNLDKTEKLIRLIDDMSIDLTMVSSFEHLKSVIQKYIESFSCDDFRLSLFDSVLNCGELDIYSTDNSRQTAVINYDHSQMRDLFSYHKNGTAAPGFDGLISSAAPGSYYVVTPLHFAEHIFGCCVISNSTLPLDSELYYTLVTNIGNAIQTIKGQQLRQLMLEKLESVWSFDSLTGVYNREGFKKFGGRVWDESIERHSNVMMLFADLDGLKSINDSFGHDEGDRYIRALANIFKAACHHGEVVMRYGGDEFVVISSNVTEEYAQQYVNDIQAQIKEYNLAHPAVKPLSASVGYFIVNPTSADELDHAIFQADKEMYQIKKAYVKRDKA